MKKNIKCRYNIFKDVSFLDNCEFCKKRKLCNSGSRSIFIVDDDAIILEEMEEYFVHLGYDCYIFRTVLEAIESLKIFNCDIIISDYQMEPLDGLFFVKYAKKNKLSDLIILNSGMANGYIDVPRGIYFFCKPLDLPDISDFFEYKFRGT